MQAGLPVRIFSQPGEGGAVFGRADLIDPRWDTASRAYVTHPCAIARTFSIHLCRIAVRRIRDNVGSMIPNSRRMTKVVTINSIRVKAPRPVGLDLIVFTTFPLLLYFSLFFIVNELSATCVNRSQAG